MRGNKNAVGGNSATASTTTMPDAAASTTTMPMPWHQQNHAAATKTTKTNQRKLGYSWFGRQLETINLREKKKQLSCSQRKYNNKNEPCPGR